MKPHSIISDKICYIIGAGDNYGLDFVAQDGDLVIAADGGLTYLQQQGIVADLVVGDFDSLPQKPTQPHVIALSNIKDDTDMYAAVCEGINRGYKVFYLYCGTGGRFEHTFANIQTLASLSQHNMMGYLIGFDHCITAITNCGISFADCCRGFVSVFSYSDKATGVYLKGLKYELKNAILTNTFPIGVSNEFIGVESTIIVNDGTLMIVFPRGYNLQSARPSPVNRQNHINLTEMPTGYIPPVLHSTD